MGGRRRGQTTYIQRGAAEKGALSIDLNAYRPTVLYCSACRHTCCSRRESTHEARGCDEEAAEAVGLFGARRDETNLAAVLARSQRTSQTTGDLSTASVSCCGHARGERWLMVLS
jgi:hypothetical protein